MLKYGDRNSVWNETAKQTRGGLMKADLILSRTGKIVSKKKSNSAREMYQKNGGFKKKVAQPESEPEAPAPTPAPTPTPEPEKPKKRRRRRKKNEKK